MAKEGLKEKKTLSFFFFELNSISLREILGEPEVSNKEKELNS